MRGYTRFTEEHGDQAAARLVTRFADLADAVVTGWRGKVLELRGDEAVAVFTSARDALHAAVDLQSRLGEERLHEPTFEVRIGLDAGDAVPVKGGYRSGALNRAARLQSIARPGEVLASDMVVGLARKTDGLVYLDRGNVELKGLSEPVKVVQVVPEDRVPEDVPKFSVETLPPTNLSPQPTRFVGREQAVSEVTALLGSGEVRLLTLTGPGGIGKTRLAIRASESSTGRFPDGVFFVPLASSRDADSVFHAVAQALGVSEIGGQPSLTAVQNYLRGKRLLLVLDNLEQAVDTAPQVADLVSACPGLTALVTSREVLHVYGEQEYPVPPMSIPDPAGSVDPDDLTRYESVRLFLDRVSLVQPGFQLTAENAPAVAEICYRLDGLPLAIELAAARIKVFGPRVLLARLDNRLSLLVGGSRNLPARQQTLRDAIAWSYDLLDSPEQALFRRLSVFVGGCTLEAAEAVCNAQGDLDIDVMDGLCSLVDKSLLWQHEAPGPAGYPESRFSMLETIREYALEQLERSGERDELCRRHAEYYLDLAERSYEKLMSAQRDPWRAMWDAEWGNLRSMLSWSVESRHPEIGLPVAAFLWVWCWLDGPAEIRDWVERLLAMPEAQEATLARGWGLAAAGSLAWQAGDPDPQRVPALGAMAVEIAQAHGDTKLLAGALLLAVVPDRSARERLEEVRALYRAQGNVFGHGFVAVGGIRALLAAGEHQILQEWLTEALADFRRTGDVFGQALALRALGILATYARELQRAREYLVEALDSFRSMHEKRYLPLVLLALGGISRLLGEPERAADEFCEALAFVQQRTDRRNVASCLEGLAGVALDQGQHDQAAMLVGAARRLRDSSPTVPFPSVDVLNPGLEQAVYNAMDPRTFERISRQGYDMTEEEALAIALAVRAVNAPGPR